MRKSVCALLCAIAVLPACKSASNAVDGVKSASSAVGQAVGGVTTSLVNVDLSNVLNDVAVKLNIDKSNIPINAQIPISIAANVCGVSINILSIGGGGDSQGCTATTASPELVQAVQQQLAANGGVGGGAQTNTGTTPSGTTTTQPAPATSPTTTTTQPPAQPQNQGGSVSR